MIFKLFEPSNFPFLSFLFLRLNEIMKAVINLIAVLLHN